VLPYWVFLAVTYYHTLKYVILLQHPDQCSQFTALTSKNRLLPCGSFFPPQPERITCLPLPWLSFLGTYSPNLLALCSSPLWASNDQIPFFPRLPPDKGSERSQLWGHPLQTLLDSLFCTHLPAAEAPFFSAQHILYLKSLSIPRKATSMVKLSRKLQSTCPFAKIYIHLFLLLTSFTPFGPKI